jgi:hypothetical protein
LGHEPDPEARADFGILGYAITSMQHGAYPSAGEILLGADPSSAERAEISLDKLVTGEAAPMFLWHTAEDAYVPTRETYRVAAASTGTRVPHRLMSSRTVPIAWALLMVRAKWRSGPRSPKTGSGACPDRPIHTPKGARWPTAGSIS